MYIQTPNYRERVYEQPLLSFSDPKDQAAALLFMISLYLLVVEQNIVLFAVTFLAVTFLYHPHRLLMRGRYEVPSEELMM